MICVGIDVAKDKYDCFILSSEGEVLADVFTIPNNAEGFDTLLQTIRRCARPEDKIKVGLEATGHYSYNILGFLLNEGLDTYVINPLHTNLYRKSLSLRKTKTDRVDARTIAAMLMSDVDLKSYTDTAYHNEELKSLTSKTLTAERQSGGITLPIIPMAVIASAAVPPIHTVKERVVFFRAQREKISTLKPLTVRIFAAAFSPPKTGNRISKPCLRFRPLHFSGKTVCTFATFTVGFCGASRPAPPTSNKEQNAALTARESVRIWSIYPCRSLFYEVGRGFIFPATKTHFSRPQSAFLAFFSACFPLIV